MVAQDLGIYLTDESAPVFHYHLDQLIGPLAKTWSYYHDCSLFVNSNHRRKVAFLQIPYPVSNSIDQIIDTIYDAVDVIFVFGSELHARTVEFIYRYDKPKIVYFVCGSLQDKLVNSRQFYFLDWFTTSVHFYKNIRPSTLYQLDPYAPKPLMFDALLGRKKLHRDHAYDFITNNNLDTQGILTYVNDYQLNFSDNDTSMWIWEDTGLDEHQGVNWTVERVKYYGHKMSLSQVIPLNVYNQTAYSLVCETNYENNYVFYTEKTVKPILARRLFIHISHQHSLAVLQELGFKTFHGIINESYDEVEAVEQRHVMALEQLKWLCAQDQNTILNKCRDIVDHNFNLMYGRDWYKDMRAPLTRILLNQ